MFILITFVVVIICMMSETIFRLVQVLAIGSVVLLGMSFYGMAAFKCFADYFATGKDEALGAGVLGVIISLSVPFIMIFWVASVEGIVNMFFNLINYITRGKD